MFLTDRVRFECKSCKEATLLPVAILQQKSRHRPKLATGEDCVAIACPQCKHVSACKDESLPLVKSDKPDQLSDPLGKSVTDVMIQCDEPSCGIRIQVFAVVVPTQETSFGKVFSGLSAEALEWKWDDSLRCGGGFPAWLPPKSIYLS